MPLKITLAHDAPGAIAALADDIRAEESADGFAGDPFAEVPLLIPDRSWDSWTRIHLAHHRGVCARIVPIPLADGLRRAVVWATQDTPSGPWWTDPVGLESWTPAHLVVRILTFWKNASDPHVAELCDRFNQGVPGTGDARRLSLARQVAQWLADTVWTHPEWLDAPPTSTGAWLAPTLEHLLGSEPNPRDLQQQLRDGTPPLLEGGPLRILCPAAIAPAQLALLRAFANAGADLRVFRPTVSPQRWKAPSEALPDGSAAARLLGCEEAARSGWLNLSPSVTVHPQSPAPAEGPLGLWQAHLRDPKTTLTADDTDTVWMPAWSARREVEAVRDRLLEQFQDKTLEPRDVLILTPDLGTYGPLIASLFATPGLASVTWAEGESPPDIAASADPESIRQAPAIPVTLRGLGLSQTNPLAAVLLGVLSLCGDRLTAPELLQLMSHGPLQRQFGIPADAGDELRTLLEDAAACWGFDEADKADVYGQAVHTNSIGFGLERMALAAFLHDEIVLPEIPKLVQSENSTQRHVAAASHDRQRLAGAVAALVASLRQTRNALAGRALPLASWRHELSALLDTYTQVGASTFWLRTTLEQTLDQVVVDSEAVTLDLEAIRRLLQQHFELQVSHKGAFGSAVSVQPLRPGAVQPHPLIVLIGMKTGNFPRRKRTADWDPAGQKAAEVDLANQRQVFAEAVLGAQRALWVSWPARELSKGHELPPCTPVIDLMELLSNHSKDHERWQSPSARHAWSPSESSRPASYSFRRATAAASVQLPSTRKQTTPLPTWRLADPTNSLPPPDLKGGSSDQTTRTAEAFAREIAGASKTFLYQRLKVWLGEDEGPPTEREPLGLNGLDKWSLGDRVLAALRQRGLDTDLTAAEKQVLLQSILDDQHARGAMPLSSLAEVALNQQFHKVSSVIAKRKKTTRGTQTLVAHAAAIRLQLPSTGRQLHLSSIIPEVLVQDHEGQTRHLHEWIRVGAVDDKPKVWLTAWAGMCIARAQGEPVEAARLISTDNSAIQLHPTTLTGELVDVQTWLSDEGQKLAHQHLEHLTQIWWRLYRSPDRLFENTSFVLAKRCAKHREQIQTLHAKPDIAERETLQASLGHAATEDVTKAWFTFPWSRGEETDRWIQAVHSGFDPTDGLAENPLLTTPVQSLKGWDFVSLSRRLWQPLCGARLPDGKGLKRLPHWKA